MIGACVAFGLRFAESRLGLAPPAFPALITGGAADTIVPATQPRSLFADWCGIDGVDVTFSQAPGLEHVSNRPVQEIAGIEWLAGKLAGAPAQPGCRQTLG